MKRFKTLSEFHEFRQLPKPLHPLISIVDIGAVPQLDDENPLTMFVDFYSISVKRMHNVSVRYGQNPFDFNEGILSFIVPNQIFSIAVADKTKAVERSGWVINIHPDFIWNTPLAKTLRQYDFWDYALNEALFLSAKEEVTIVDIILHIQQECSANIDQFTKRIIVSQLETLLNYADRFYHRQFITRRKPTTRYSNG